MVSDTEIEAYRELREVVARLRAPDGCPWDREQTHTSLRPYVIEEAYEVAWAIGSGEASALREELGDLLWQVLIHAQLAEEEGAFDMAAVMRGIAEKLRRRHPHVFGDGEAATAAEVVARWEEQKREERGGASALEGVLEAQPALSYAQQLLRRAAGAGFAWPERRDIVAKLAEELEELALAPDESARADELGDVLLNVATYAGVLGIDAEDALRAAAAKFRHRFEAVERLAAARGVSLRGAPLEELLALWAQAKDSP
jgi:tetrapyrrole methylase family protein/MazG family protein